VLDKGMKIIITENQLNEMEQHIYDYINELYDDTDISYVEQELYDFNVGEYVMSDNIYFYYGDYSNGDMIFILYKEGYERMRDGKILEGPVLFIEDEDKIELLNQFGDLWEPVFKKWFKDNFGYGFKTIDA
jgi:hypothetical protein